MKDKTRPPERPGKKYYMLEMFAYPSGANLHTGHWFNFGPSDTYARYKKMTGCDVFHPMGFDSFGLPAENYAIKTGIHPKDSTYKNIAVMQKQLRDMGAMYNWENEVITSDPSYYKWTQWLFLELYKKGLAYRKEAPVNWCPDCATVLANEQAEDGICERCKAAVAKKNLTQWFFKITDYAEELLNDLDKIDWPEKTKLMQRHWIGKSVGVEIDFATDTVGASLREARGSAENPGGSQRAATPTSPADTIRVFTTRADTLYGVSYIVLAPEHPLVEKLTTAKQKKAVEKYLEEVKKITEIDRLSTAREKTGVPLGAYCVHPLTGEKLPVWTADYVLYTYGTGAVMGVPAHDERDFLFAKKYRLPIINTIAPATEPPAASPDNGCAAIPAAGASLTCAFAEYGTLTAEGPFKGLTSEKAIEEIAKALKKVGKGEAKTNYRLRDWLVSRQRYWGAPIPMIHCAKCGEVPVPEKDLPVELPYDVKFKPTGNSPLAEYEKFMNVSCPKCGKAAKRDPDTLDTFVCSSWYFLRYPDSKNDKAAWDKKIIDRMLPVDKYVGGAEHACMHLLYARFITKALRDMGHLSFDEPFASLVHQGTILGADGQKMSKSIGNTVNPDGYVAEYGADVFRMYLMFGFDYITGGPWSDDGVKAMAKYIERVERLVEMPDKNAGVDGSSTCGSQRAATPTSSTEAEEELNFVRHQTIAAIRRDIENFSFNTCVAGLMKFTNALYVHKTKEATEDLIKLLAPFAPSVAQRLWEKSGHKTDLMNEEYPKFDEKALIRKTVEIAIQINSKIRGKIVVPSDADEKQILAQISREQPGLLSGATPKKTINVPGKLINLIV